MFSAWDGCHQAKWKLLIGQWATDGKPESKGVNRKPVLQNVLNECTVERVEGCKAHLEPWCPSDHPSCHHHLKVARAPCLHNCKLSDTYFLRLSLKEKHDAHTPGRGTNSRVSCRPVPTPPGTHIHPATVNMRDVLGAWAGTLDLGALLVE